MRLATLTNLFSAFVIIDRSGFFPLEDKGNILHFSINAVQDNIHQTLKDDLFLSLNLIFLFDSRISRD